MILLQLPLLCLVMIVVFLWSFNVHRRRVLGVWSNFQPLLTALMILLAAVCLPSAWEFFSRVRAMQPAPDQYLGALGALYLIGLTLALQIPFLLRGWGRGRLNRPRPRRRTEPGYPFNGKEW